MKTPGITSPAARHLRFRPIIAATVLLCLCLIPGASCLKRASDTSPATITALDARTGDEIWRVDAPVATVSAIAPARGVILVLGHDACPTSESIFAGLDAADGHVLWSIDARGSDCGDEESIATTGDVAIACTDRGLAALDIHSGVARWYAPHACSSSPPLLATGAVIASGGSDEAIALDAATGTGLWRSRAAAGRFLGADESVGVALSSDQAELVAFDVHTGVERWRVAVEAHTTIEPPRFTVGTGVVLTAFEVEATSAQPWFVAHLSAVDLTSGERMWRIEQGGDHEERWQAIAGTDSRLFGLHVSGTHTTVDAIDPRSGAIQWSFGPVGETYEQRPLVPVPGGVLFLRNGMLTLFTDGEQSPSWQTPIEGGVEAVGMDNERVYASSTGTWRQIDY